LQFTKGIHKTSLHSYIPAVNKLKRKLKKIIFTISSKTTKHFRKNLTEEAKDLNVENYKNIAERNSRTQRN
jgi:hypothetical protein